ncbi:hypothetical protein GPECTOR_83g268 [Gonium pectorale]|uniref:FAD-binding domain-containing protein n=1 Tax=Gonium pectorale TaxID=33097 RepID=A0A150G1A9_GONPE|nr:hypothetical protein GPECTOR_83g268 [Gonium pectorale]|eukprot:KXZ43656.1 hypothetical protein GPECTOR_83g268 [Gonium pectorale]
MDAPEVEDEEDGHRWDPSSLTAVVVGAGLSGSLAAHYLAMRGYSVRVLERGPRPRAGDAAGGPLVLTSRAAIAFEELRMDSQRRVGPTATPLRGVWDVVGRSLRPVDTTSPLRRVFVTDRSGLVADIVDAAERRYPGKVIFQFNTELVRAELKNRTAVVRPTRAAAAGTPAAAAAAGPVPAEELAGLSDDERDEPYDLLVGADGADSTVRRILTAKVKDLKIIRPVEDAAASKNVSRLPRPSKEPLPGFFTHRPQEYMYEWSAPASTSASRPSLALYVDADGSVAGTVSGLSRWDDADAAAAELAAAFPDSLPPEWAQEIGRQVAAPSSPAPCRQAILQCSQFHGPRAVLLGDAAHQVTGATPPGAGSGQGPSAAVESVRTLALVLRGAQDDLEKVPEVYTKVRADAVMAMQMLEFMELTRGPHREALKYASAWFAFSAAITQGLRILSEMVGGLLAALMPKRFLTVDQLVSKLSDRRIGYAEVMRMMQGYAMPVIMLFLAGTFFALFQGYSRILA